MAASLFLLGAPDLLQDGGGQLPCDPPGCELRFLARENRRIKIPRGEEYPGVPVLRGEA